MEYLSVDMAINALKRDPAIIEQALKGVIIGVYREAEGYIFEPTRHMVNPGNTRLNRWETLTSAEAAFLFNEPLEAACFMPTEEAWHIIAVIGTTPWIKQVEFQLSRFFTANRYIDYLKQQYELMEPRLIMDYSPHYSQQTRRATSSAEDFTVKRASLSREIAEVEKQYRRMEPLINALPPNQEEILTRYFRARQNLRSTARSMRRPIAEIQQQGYEALKALASNL